MTKFDRITITMACLFVLTAMLAIAITPVYVEEGVQAFDDSENVTYPIIYIGMILGFTAVLLVIIKLGFKRILHFIILFAVFVTISYVIFPFASTVLTEDEEWERVPIGAGIKDIDMADLDGDGRDEILDLREDGVFIVHSNDGKLWYRRNVDAFSVFPGMDAVAVIENGRLAILDANGTARTTGIEAESVDTGIVDGRISVLIINGSGAFLLDSEDLQPTWMSGPGYTSGIIISDHVIVSGSVTSSYQNNSLIGTINETGSLFDGVTWAVLVNGKEMTILTTDLKTFRKHDFDSNITVVHARNIWGKPRPEMVVLEGENVHIIYGKELKWDWKISSIAGDLRGTSTAVGEWDGDDDTMELVVVEGGKASSISIFVGKRTDAEELASLITLPVILSFCIAFALTAVFFFYPEWYIIDVVMVLVAAGVATLFGISFAILPSIILLVGLMAYDAFAVYQSKHMIALADAAVEKHTPLLLVFPKDKGYSYIDQGSIKDQIDKGEEREAMFLGLGDLIIPTVLVVSSYRYLDTAVTVGGVGGNFIVAMCTMIGILAGFMLLSYQVASGKPQAGLPALNSGALAGYFISVIAIYGSLGF